MAKDNSRGVAEALNAVIQVLSPLDDKDRTRVLNSVNTFFDHESGGSRGQGEATVATSATHQPSMRPSFSEDRAPSPKEFLFQKQPRTDVERIACLAFYLTHFRDTPHFKTLDLAKLNTEAAQIKFSNATYATDNATKAGFLAVVAKGQKQITAWGEQFVTALPDREAALKAISQARARRNARRRK
jgi:restriction endonuclease Mrr